MVIRDIVCGAAAFGLLACLASAHAREPQTGVTAPLPPQQTALGRDIAPIERDGFVLTPLANFQLDARVLGRRDYDSGPEAAISPLDLALGWNRMSDPAIVAALDISQDDRWYSYRYPGFSPISADEIRTSSANMHMIPANDMVLRQLRSLREGDAVTLGGYLVDVTRPRDGFLWRSSTSREDTEAGACEIVLVEWLRVW